MYEQHGPLLYMFAGIAVFMYGMTMASENLQNLAGNRVRDLLGKLSDRPILGVGIGIILTFLIQSSSAVTTMLVGLGKAGVVNLAPVMGVLVGSAVGTTLTVQLLSLNISQYGLGVFTCAFFVYFLTDKRVLRQVMGVFMGFGLIFWGIEIIGIGTSDLRQANIFMGILDYLQAYPIWAIVLTAVFTAVVHSSAVTIGFAMSLANSGAIGLTDAIFWVYGANIGTTATGLVASIGGNHVGRQVAWAHFFYKALSVVMFFFFTEAFAQMIATGWAARDIANAHTAFNIIAALVFLFFIKWGTRGIEMMFPPLGSEKEFSVKYLSRHDTQNISIALSYAEREVMRMGDIVITMIRDSVKLLENRNVDLEESIVERDNKVDLLHREINLFVAEHVSEATAQHQNS